MTKIILTNLLRLAIIIPFIIVFLQKHNKRNYYRIFLFIVIFIGYQITIKLPYYYYSLNFIGGNWNWDGKILGVLFGLLCFVIFKRHFKEYNYFTFKQHKANFKKALIASIAIVVLATIVWFIFGESEFDLETLAFQLTIPGLDEEIMFRGILLGLLMSSLKLKIKLIGNPGILLTSILFGLIHAFNISKSNKISFELIYFLQTGLAGYVWAWVTVKSKSLVLAVLSHNFSNFFGTLATMIK